MVFDRGMLGLLGSRLSWNFAKTNLVKVSCIPPNQPPQIRTIRWLELSRPVPVPRSRTPTSKGYLV
jgi:hypothetical protein